MIKYFLNRNRFFPIFCALLIFLGWYQVFWRTLLPRHHTLKTDLASAHKMKETLIQGQKGNESQAQRLARSAIEVEELRSQLWTGDEDTSPYSFLEKLAEGLVEITGVHPQEAEKTDYYWVLPLQLNLQGHYPQLLTFITSLEKDHEFIEFAGLNLHSTGDQFNLIKADLFIKFSVLPGALGQKKALSPPGSWEIMLDPFSHLPSSSLEIREEGNLKQVEMESYGDSQVTRESPFLEPYVFPVR